MKHPQRILVAVDSGDAALDAWNEASLIAKAFGAELSLVHAVPEAGEHSPTYNVVSAKIAELFDDLATRAEADGLRVSHDYAIHSGQPAGVILDAVLSTRPDLLVLGAGEKGTLERILMGSTAEEVLRRCAAPVWLVRPNRVHRDVKRVLCAIDGSDPAREALASAVLLSRSFTATLGLLTVVAPGAANGSPDQRNIESCASEFDLHGIAKETLIREGEAEHEILVAAREWKADLLILGSAGRTGFSRLLNANTAEKVARAVPCSLLTVKRPQA